MNNKNHKKEEQFKTFFAASFPRVKSFALMLLKSEAEAEDVAQDIFLSLWEKPELWCQDKTKKLDNYLFVITKNKIFDIFRHREIERRYNEEYLKEMSRFEALIEDKNILNGIYYEEVLITVRMFLEQLPEKRRKIFELSRLGNLSNKEIADKLNISVRTVESQIYSVLKELKKILK